MNITLKKFTLVLLSVLLMLSVSFPMTALAEGTLGNEEPYLYCTFVDSNGKMVDGNALSAGNYTVEVMLSDMENASILQYTADYDASVITSLTVSETIADDEESNVSLGGIKNDNGNLVVVLASEDDNYSALDANGVLITSLDVTVTTNEDSIDFADYFEFSNDPDLTFVEADYADGYEDAYVLDVNAETAYNTYLMTADASPVVYFTLTGDVNVSTELDGSYIGNAVGVVGITASLDVDGVTVTAVTDENGQYTFSNIPEGNYEVSFSGPTTIDRSATLTVSRKRANYDAIALNPIGIITCDYNKDSYITGGDKLVFNAAFTTYNVYCDLNGDGYITSGDKLTFNTFISNNSIKYAYSDATL